MNLSEAQRKYLLRDQVLFGAAFNAVFNAFLAWLTFRSHGGVPMQGQESILNDVLGTALLLPLGICTIGTPLIRKFVRAGKVEPWNAPSVERTILLWLPANSVLRGLLLALAALATFAPMILGVQLALGVQQMSVSGFATLKFFYAGSLAAIVSPIVALYAMATSTTARVELVRVPLKD